MIGLFKKYSKWILAALLTLLLAIVWVPIPKPEQDYSYVLYDRSGELMAAQVADDEQWRFPLQDSLPQALKDGIRLYEDEYFYWHPGINPISVCKAAVTNIRAQKVVRGASTLSMQLMRIYRGNRSRTFLQKAIESLGALKLELLYSKDEILHMWADRAPFGGNTVGVAAASWRYFQRDLYQLSWAEYATLAVLPNAPSSVHLSKNISLLKKRRNALLGKLHDRGIISATELRLAMEEEVPELQHQLPMQAWHLMQHCKKQYPNTYSFTSTIDRYTQEKLQSIINEFSTLYQADGIHHAAAMVIDNAHNQVLAYVGNSSLKDQPVRYVDCVQAPRSYGSLLKPFLYAYAIDEGYFLPNELVKDIPTHLNDFSPKNFDLQYRGWVQFDQMVSQSLNVPAVRVLNYVGLPSFHSFLRNSLALSDLNANPHHHGLSLILGGAESTMWDLSRIYKGLAQHKLHHSDPFRAVQYLKNDTILSHPEAFSFQSASAHHTIKAMTALERPPEEQEFIKYGGSSIAWKTGTSYGHRDAWAIGISPEYTVAVWVGNENGQGVYDLTGVKKAAPILFQIFGSLPNVQDFPPLELPPNLTYCTETGRLKGSLCSSTSRVRSSTHVHSLRQCTDHKVTQNPFAERDTLLHLDPIANYYYKQYYGASLASESDPTKTAGPSSLKIVYPSANRIVFIPKKLDQKTSRVQLSAYSNQNNDQVFWYLNGSYLRHTSGTHQLEMDLPLGSHHLFITNSQGLMDEVTFEVVKRTDS